MFTLSQFGKDEETFVSIPADAVPSLGINVQVTTSNTVTLNCLDAPENREPNQYEGEDDASGKDPFRYSEWDNRVDFRRPAVEDEQVDSSVAISSDNEDAEKEIDEEEEIGDRRPARTSLEVVEVNIIPLLLFTNWRIIAISP